MSRSALRYLLLFVSIFMITNGFAQLNGPIVRVVANKPDNSPKKDQKKEPSKENINHWLNSPQIQEWASKPELQAMIALFTKQIFVVNGRIFGTDDFEPTPYPLQGASIQVKCVGDTSEVHGAVTNDEGEFLIPIFLRQKLKSNQLHIKISYIGMDGVDRVFTPNEVKLLGQKVLQVEFDSLVLKSNAVTMAEAEVIGELQKMYQRGDTVIFNADAYEMPSGSVLLDLVRRLPGLQYIGGKLTYMNRDIEEIRLNGDDYFKHDMGVALQNMRHDKLKSLKVYEVPDDTLDVMSDQHLVMDMNTKDPMNVVYTGNAGFAATLLKFNHWNVNIDGTRWKKNGGQARLFFNHTTIPQAGAFVDRDVRTNAGLSYEHQLGNTKVDVGFNYGYGNNASRTSRYNRTFLPDYTQNSTSETSSGSRSHSYSGHAKLDGHFGKNTYWNTRIDLSLNENENWSNSTDSISNDLSAISRTTTSRHSRSKTKRLDWRGGVSQYFGHERETELGLYGSFGVSDGSSTNTNATQSRFYLMGDSLRQVNHLIDTPSRNINAGATARLRHRFGQYTNLGVNYEFAYSRNTNSQTYNDVLDDLLSPIDSLHYDNRYRDVSHGPTLDLKYDDKVLLLQFQGKAQPTQRSADNTQYTHHDFNRFTSVQYRANARMELKMNDKKNKLIISYNGANSLPSPTDISTNIDYSNPMNIRMGNPHLKEAFRHQMRAEFQLGSTMTISANHNRTTNQQTTLSVIDRQTGVRTTTPTNINGNWDASAYLFLTRQFGEVTLATIGSYTRSHTLSYVQDFGSSEAVRSATDWQRADATLMGTYGNKYLTLIAQGKYTLDHNRSDYIATATRGQQAMASLNVEYTLPLKVTIKLKSDFNYSRRFGYELASANRSEYLWNASLEYRFLGIVTAALEWRDILKSRRGFNASTSSTGWSETQQYGNTSMVLLRLGVKLFK